MSKSIDHAVEQNALYATTTRMSKIITAYWDENSYEYNATSFTFSPSQMITVGAGGDTLLNEVGATSFRVGNFGTSADRRFFRTGFSSTPIANFGFEADDNGTMGVTNVFDADDIDDFTTNGNFVSIYEAGAKSAAYSYKEDIWMNIQVDYVSESPSNAADFNASTITYDFPTAVSATPTNLKMVTIQTRRFYPQEGNVTIFTMRTYSANIGEIKKFKADTL